MCKVFAMSNMKNVKVTKKFIKSVKDAVTKVDNDGFGYAVLNEDGSIGGERTLRPETFNALIGNPDDRQIAKLPIVAKTRNVFGTQDFKNAKSFVGHGRWSTNDKTLENTHPYFNGNMAMIHNGVVRDPDKKIKNLVTTNDTEILFRCWEDGGMPMIEETVTGYYALAILESNGLMHIIRDDKAMLYMSYSRQIDSYIFATTPEIITKVCKEMGWKTEEPEEMNENFHATFDRNEFEWKDIFPRADYGKMDATARKALGYSSSKYDDYDDYNYGGWGKKFDPNDSPLNNIVDATKKAPAVTSEEDDEPSYRENKRAKASLEAQIAEGEMDRQFIDDGAPNVSYTEDVEITDEGVAYMDGADLRKIS